MRDDGREQQPAGGHWRAGRAGPTASPRIRAALRTTCSPAQTSGTAATGTPASCSRRMSNVSGSRKKVRAASASIGNQKTRPPGAVVAAAGGASRGHRARSPEHRRQHHERDQPRHDAPRDDPPHLDPAREQIPGGERAQHRAEVVGAAMKSERPTPERGRRDSAMSASRGGVRSPFPTRSTTRKPITCHAAFVTAISGRTSTAVA